MTRKEIDRLPVGALCYHRFLNMHIVVTGNGRELFESFSIRTRCLVERNISTWHTVPGSLSKGRITRAGCGVRRWSGSLSWRSSRRRRVDAEDGHRNDQGGPGAVRPERRGGMTEQEIYDALRSLEPELKAAGEALPKMILLPPEERDRIELRYCRAIKRLVGLNAMSKGPMDISGFDGVLQQLVRWRSGSRDEIV